jgi:hypothetical protein
MFWYAFKYIFRNIGTWKYVSHFWTIIWKCEESTIIIGVFILSNGWNINMYQCVLNFSYYNHDLLKFLNKNMFEI